MSAPGDQHFARRPSHITGARIDQVAAGILAVLIAIPSPISVNLTVGGAFSLALTPVTFPAIWRNTRGRWLLITILTLAPTGWLVAQNALLHDKGRTLSTGIFLYQTALPVGLLASVAGAYWCITKLGLQRFLLFSFAGLLATAMSTYQAVNPWKYGLALPISMLVLLLLARNRLLLALIVTPFLAAVSVAADYRSWTALLAIASLLAVSVRSNWKPPSGSRVASLGLVAFAAGGIVAVGLAKASTAGLLGEYLKQRTVEQLEASNGNLFLGGRPEWGAAIALWRENPLGIGIGVTPSFEDFWLAIRSMPLGSRGLQEISNVAKSFQQGEINFHSTFWTFWGVYGFAGVVFSILILLYFAQATMMAAAKIGQLNVRAAVALLMLSSIWDTLFSPTITAHLAIALATALQILCRPTIPLIQSKDSEDEKFSAHQRDHHHAQ